MTIAYSPGASPDDAARALAAMQARIRDMRPVLTPGAEDLATVIGLGFETSTAPDGTAWLPNAQSTIDRKRGSSKPNVDTTRLKRSIRAAATSNTITLGTNVPYAGAVQNGSTRSGTLKHPSYSARTVAGRTKSGKKSKSAGKRTANIGPTQKRPAGTPWKATIEARPFLPFTAAGGLMSTGPIGAELARLSKRVVTWIVDGRVT